MCVISARCFVVILVVTRSAHEKLFPEEKQNKGLRRGVYVCTYTHTFIYS